MTAPSLLQGWRRRRPRRLVLLTRIGCHLCAEMEAQVRAALTATGARGQLELVDVDVAGREDPSLLERYHEAVPVLLVDGQEVARWRVDEVTLRQVLRR